MRKRQARQEVIRRLVRRERIRAQRELVALLEAEGYVCTQATVSRDVTDMGLRKTSGGVYVLAEDLHLQRMVSELVVEVVRSDRLVLVKTSPGAGQGVAAALDRAGIDGVLGSIAGDDTILVIAAGEDSAERLVAHVDKYRAGR